MGKNALIVKKKKKNFDQGLICWCVMRDLHIAYFMLLPLTAASPATHIAYGGKFHRFRLGLEIHLAAVPLMRVWCVGGLGY